MNHFIFNSHTRGVRQHSPKQPMLWRMLLAPIFLLGGWLLLLRSDVGHTPLTTRLYRLIHGNPSTADPPQRIVAPPTEEEIHDLAQTEAIRYIDEFLGIASHELRTPLTSMKLHIEVALRKLHDLATQDDASTPIPTTLQLQALLPLLERSHLSIERMNRLVGDLIAVSQIQQDDLILSPSIFDLTSFTQSVVAHQQSFASHRQLLFEGTTALFVNADAMRIEQVLMCYLANALKYAGTEYPITIRVQQLSSVAQIEVVDRGPGLAPEQQALVFERFAQVWEGTTTGFRRGFWLRVISQPHADRATRRASRCP